MTGILLLGAAASMTVGVIGRAGTPVEMVTPTVIAVAVGGALLVAGGVLLLGITTERDIALLALLSSALIVTTVLGLFSVGIVVLPFAIASVVLLVRRASGRERLAIPLLTGPVVVVGLAVVLVIWVQSPVVECRDDGVATSSRPWWSGGGSSGSSTSSRDRVTTGSVETPDGSYFFRCEGSELTRFERE